MKLFLTPFPVGGTFGMFHQRGIMVMDNDDRAGYVKSNRAKFSLYGARQRDALKLEMIAEYGGRCCHCREDDPVVLSLDHINDDAYVETELYGEAARGGHKQYQRLKQLGWPKDRFQLLCFNCNAKKEHQRRRTAAMNRWGQPALATSEERSQIQASIGVRSHNKSGFKGVFWSGQRQRWQVSIMVDYKNRHCGFFDSLVAAAKAHRNATLEIWGDKVQVLTDEEIEMIAAEHSKPQISDVSADSLGL